MVQCTKATFSFYSADKTHSSFTSGSSKKWEIGEREACTWQTVEDHTTCGDWGEQVAQKEEEHGFVLHKIEGNYQLIALSYSNRMPKVVGRSGSEDKSCCLCLCDSFSHSDVHKGAAVFKQELWWLHPNVTHTMLQTPCVSLGKHLILGEELMTGHDMTTRHISKTVNDKTALHAYP